jgi:hypothetical protein
MSVQNIINTEQAISIMGTRKISNNVVQDNHKTYGTLSIRDVLRAINLPQICQKL